MPDVRMPDGTIIRNVPAGTSRDEIMARYQRARQAGAVKDNRPTSFWRGFNDTVQTASSNLGALLENVNPVEMAIDKAADLAGFHLPTQRENDARYRRKQMAAPTRGSTAGNVVGGIAASLPTMFLPGGPVVQGAAGGALLSEGRSAKQLAKNAAFGAVTGKVADVVGRRAIAPVLERVGRAAPVRKVAQAVLGNSAPAFVTPTERILVKANPEVDDAVRNLKDASRLGLPYSLADSAPKLRAIAGSVARKSPNGRELAEKTFVPRARGQADRAVSAIDERLAPVVGPTYRGDIKAAAQRASEPFYEAAKQRMAPIDDDLTSILSTPAGKSALAKAKTIAQNEGRDPLKLGFDLNDQGEVVLREAPSFDTLQLAKRGFDAELAPFRNPVTNRLDLEGRPDLQAINNLRQRLNTRMGEINPDYSAGNAAYAKQMARRDALDVGKEMFSGRYPEREFSTALGRMDQSTLPEMQRGYSTAMADKVDNVRLSGNPYEAIYGTPLQQKKVDNLFPDGAPDFRRIYDLESDMSKTAWETMGGSPTQQRAMADQLFDNNLAGYGHAMLEASGNPKLAMGKAMLEKARDRARIGSQQRADELAPILFDTSNPDAQAKLLEDILRRAMERREAYRRATRMMALPVTAGVIGATRP